MEHSKTITEGSAKLAALMGEHGWKRADLAKELDCSPVHVWRISTGRQRPGEELMRTLHKRFGIGFGDWFVQSQEDAA